ncbi:unnamed protein product, partial [marine sediment metagenome]
KFWRACAEKMVKIAVFKLNTGSVKLGKRTHIC